MAPSGEQYHKHGPNGMRSSYSQRANHLILVCCHATYDRSRAGDDEDAYLAEANWVLQPFQKSNPATGKESEHRTFLRHIASAGDVLDQDPRAWLIYSGGKTQSQVDITEAESYYQCNAEMNPERSLDRTDVETNATDSYQNLLFSILAFRRRIGAYPERISVVTHAFKDRRFYELHVRALKWPVDKINVLGIDPPFTPADHDQTISGEIRQGYGLFSWDLYGVRDPLASKRRDRGWNDAVGATLGDGLETEVQDLLAWQGGRDGRQVFPGRLPWEIDRPLPRHG